ncbi:hypothetical protein DCC81_25120 [Chitinophaga parva]|uniref:Flagellar motor protein MotB n=1 Tax=Chitinophaga parva TaxID=2169414 RepID=A0A2T7BB59_9BACT|nr:hypothetical protein [Chitinophaga parva]PUZ21293.1 hypothetical protein DCC81_25120 [Chitinophaga parva]
MKFLFTCCLILLSGFHMLAQDYDAEAKLQYQQAENAYDKGDYLNAMNICNSLMQKIGTEPPRVAYLLLKSYTMSLEKGTSIKNYKELDTYASLATRFIGRIQSSEIDYPAEKTESFPVNGST